MFLVICCSKYFYICNFINVLGKCYRAVEKKYETEESGG